MKTLFPLLVVSACLLVPAGLVFPYGPSTTKTLIENPVFEKRGDQVYLTWVSSSHRVMAFPVKNETDPIYDLRYKSFFGLNVRWDLIQESERKTK